MDKQDVEYIMNHIQEYTWKDASKTQMWMRMLIERGFDDLVVQTLKILKGVEK
jgi:cobalamin biosynthesis Co2+ chelatase CbiK